MGHLIRAMVDTDFDPSTTNDFLYATGYAWGRADGGLPIDASQIYRFGAEWAIRKHEFNMGRLSSLPSMTLVFSIFFADEINGRV